MGKLQFFRNSLARPTRIPVMTVDDVIAPVLTAHFREKVIYKIQNGFVHVFLADEFASAIRNSPHAQALVDLIILGLIFKSPRHNVHVVSEPRKALG